MTTVENETIHMALQHTTDRIQIEAKGYGRVRW